MILTTISKAIRDRIMADTGTGGIYEGGTWNRVSGAWAIYATPSPITFPYIWYTINLQGVHSADTDEYDVTVVFSVIDDKDAQADDTPYSSRMSAVVDRLVGDAVLQTGRVPSYGFNRHALVLATNGYSAKATTCLVRATETGMTDENRIFTNMTVTFRVTARAANP